MLIIAIVYQASNFKLSMSKIEENQMCSQNFTFYWVGCLCDMWSPANLSFCSCYCLLVKL